MNDLLTQIQRLAEQSAAFNDRQKYQMISELMAQQKRPLIGRSTINIIYPLVPSYLKIISY
ncbi:hypothetical protein [Latilactobacillus sakei]|uniref:hypothetical protein n=1 Tax=Latilactobacillus sakei TaxID=1599 RepID=UPI0024DFEEED|nr:hypothetical protein [Latilactobacillus sakei]